MRIRFSAPAAADLEEIALYIAQDNPAAARRLMAKTEAACQLLSTFPAAGRKGRVGKTRELIITGQPYILVYTATAKEVVVVAFFHASRDIARISRAIRARKRGGI